MSWTLQLYGHDGDPATQWTPQPTPITAAEDRSYADGTVCDEPTCSDGSAAWCCACLCKSINAPTAATKSTRLVVMRMG